MFFSQRIDISSIISGDIEALAVNVSLAQPWEHLVFFKERLHKIKLATAKYWSIICTTLDPATFMIVPRFDSVLISEVKQHGRIVLDFPALRTP